MMVTDGDLHVGDRIIMLATFFVMLVIFSMYLFGLQHLKLVTSTFGYQHIWSPTSVANINVTIQNGDIDVGDGCWRQNVLVTSLG